MEERLSKNIIVVNDYDYVQGGATKVAVDTANLLASNGYNVTFFCGVSDPNKSSLDKSIRVVSVNKDDALSGKHYFRGLYNVKAKKLFNELLKDFHPQDTVIHIHGWTKALTASFITPAYKRGFKSILTIHDYFTICPNGGLYNYQEGHICELKPFSKECKKCHCDSRNNLFKKYRNLRLSIQKNRVKFTDKITAFVTISETSERLIKKELPNIKTTRIYNFVDISKNDRALHEKKNNYLYVGRIDKEKGVDLLCASFKTSDKKLLVAGSGNEFESLKQQYKDVTNITFLGWKNHDEVFELMNNSRALIMPSIWYEGAPLTLFEAFSQGLPVIASTYCAAKEFIKDNTGWIFDPYKVDELTKLVNSIEDEDIEAKSKTLYQEYWASPFSKERYLSSLVKLFDIVLKEDLND